MTPVHPAPDSSGLQVTVYGGHQYLDLPAIRLDGEEGTIITRWRPSDEDRARIAAGGDVFLFIWTFGRPLQPVNIQTNPPRLEVSHSDGVKEIIL